MNLQDYFGVKEAYKLPDVLLAALLADDSRAIIEEIKKADIDIRDYYQTEQGNRENLKQDFTPDGVCEIVAGLLRPGSVLDLCAGTGVLSLKAFEKNAQDITAVEFSERAIPFYVLSAMLQGARCRLIQGDALREEAVFTYYINENVKRQQEEYSLKAYDNVIMNPPYSLKFTDANEYEFYGMRVPTSRADYGFLLNGLKYLNDGGRLIAILPHGILFRGNKEGIIRQWLVESGYISAIIGLPEKLFLHTSIPVCILVLERDSKDTLFVDASKEFVAKGRQNELSGKTISKIIETISKRKDVDKYSRLVSFDEIQENNFNLNIPRYVDTSEPEELPNIKEIVTNLTEIKKQEAEAANELISMLSQLDAETAEDRENINNYMEYLRSCI